MSRSATFSVTAAGSHSSAHNSREEKPKYLIGTFPGSENFYDLRHSDSNFLKLAAAKYKENTGQKMQQKQIDALIKETVLTLEAHHTEADVQKVFDELAAKYGGHYITELSIHRDEGHFEDENGITYYPTKDILKKDDEWYIIPLTESIQQSPEYKPKAEEFSEKVDISTFKPVHNVHAHVKFSMFNLETGKTGRMKHNELNDRIKTAARVLKLKYESDKKSDKRSTVAEVKSQHKAVRNEKVSNFLEHGHTLEDKNREIQQLRYNFREAQKRITALEGIDAEHKKELHRLNSEINKIKGDNAEKVAELEAKLSEAGKVQHEPINASRIVQLQDENKILKLTNTALENELKTTKFAPVPAPVKAENEASRTVEAQIEAEHLPEIKPKTTELDIRQIEFRADEKEAKFGRGEHYVAELMEKYTRFGMLNKEAFAQDLGGELKETATILSRAQEAIRDLSRHVDKAKNALKITVQSSKKGLEAIFRQITGKSTEQINEQRREQERAIRERQQKEHEAQQTKEPAPVRKRSTDLSL